MEFKKDLAPVISFSTPNPQGQEEVKRYGVLTTIYEAEDSGSPGSNFKILCETLKAFNAAGMGSDQLQLPEGQGYKVVRQTGVVSLKSTEPSAGAIISPDRAVVYQIVPDSENILSSGVSGGQEVTALPRGSGRLVVKMTVAEPIRLPELEKAA